jgi:hypothetical protein
MLGFPGDLIGDGTADSGKISFFLACIAPAPDFRKLVQMGTGRLSAVLVLP